MDASQTFCSALEAEPANPQADLAYYSGAIGFQAALRGLHQPYKPAGFDKIPDGFKDPEGNWWTIHTASIAILVNTSALKGKPVPKSYADLLKPEYKGMIAYDDPTWGGTGFTFVYGIKFAALQNFGQFSPVFEGFVAFRLVPGMPQETRTGAQAIHVQRI